MANDNMMAEHVTYLQDPPRHSAPNCPPPSQNLDQIHRALPALKAALVHPRLDIILPQTCLRRLMLLGHQLNPDIPPLSPRNTERATIVERHVQHAVCDFGRKSGQ
jgi:hypothetical protein